MTNKEVNIIENYLIKLIIAMNNLTELLKDFLENVIKYKNVNITNYGIDNIYIYVNFTFTNDKNKVERIDYLQLNLWYIMSYIYNQK